MRRLLFCTLMWAAACGTTGNSAGNPSVGSGTGSDTSALDLLATESGGSAPSDTAGAPKDTGVTDGSKTDAPKADVAKTDAAKTDSAKTDSGLPDNGVKVVCGDSFCAEGLEDCNICEYDCGPCKAVCGDGKCGTGEACSNCPKDCGGCAGVCGNGYCDPIEDCKACPQDCGACAPNCGDGTCNKASETCDDCPLDCGKCTNEPCDPYTSKNCKDFEQCFPYAEGELVCIGAGKLAKGDKCFPLVDCQKGLICINSTCAVICDATGKQPQYGCPAGKQCVEVGQPGKPSAGVGACL